MRTALVLLACLLMMVMWVAAAWFIWVQMAR